MKNRIAQILDEDIFIDHLTKNKISTQIVRTASGKTYFLKSGPKSRIYRCEANGLKEIQKSGTIRCPIMIAADEDFLLSEYLEIGQHSSSVHEKFGTQFAKMHWYVSDTFGFYEDNFIGGNPQPNIPTEQESTSWIDFYFNKRLLYQYQLTEENGYVTPTLKEGFMKLEKIIHKILGGSDNAPRLLHGDLWNGNFLVCKEGDPILIDPAVYYGNREADLAMTRLFGGFPPEFYKAYQQTFPLDEGWEYRENVYKLYHVLNHLNLFGRSYLYEAERLVCSYS